MDVELDGPVEGREVEGAADWVGRTLHAGDWAGQGVEAQWLGLTDVELNVCKTRSPNSTCRGLDNFEPSPARQGLEALGFAVVGLGGPVEGRHAWMLGQGCRGGAKVFRRWRLGPNNETYRELCTSSSCSIPPH